MPYEDLDYSAEAGITTIALNRPDKLNAARAATYDELVAVHRRNFRLRGRLFGVKARVLTEQDCGRRQAVKITRTGPKSECLRAAAVVIGLTLGSASVFAQSAPASCVTSLSKESGSNSAVRMECTNATDCTFQAPAGNASALALIGAMVKTVEACFIATGLAIVKEDAVPQGTTRQYGKPGSSEMCAVLISTTTVDLADGLRATCQTVTAR